MAIHVPSVVRTTVEGAFDGEAVVNVFHHRKRDGSAVTAANLTALHTLFQGTISDGRSFAALYQSQDDALLMSEVYSKNYSTLGPVEKTSVITAPGTATGTAGPPMLAQLVKWSTAIADRTYRGRTYMPGFNTSFVSTTDADRLSATNLTNLGNRVAAWVAGWAADTTWQFVVFSKTRADTGQLDPYQEVLSGSVDPVIRIQRRRRQGG